MPKKATLIAPDGKKLTLEVPDDATESQIIEFANQAYAPQASSEKPLSEAQPEPQHQAESPILNAMKGMSARGNEIASAMVPGVFSPETIAAQKKWVEQRPAAQLGATATDMMVAVPAMTVAGPEAATVKGGAALGSLYNYLTTPGGLAEREKAGLEGAIGGALGGAVGNGIKYAKNVGSRLAAPFHEEGQNQIMSRLLRKVAGDHADLIASRLENAKTLVPNSVPTAAEAAETSGGISAMQRWAEQANPEAYAFKRMQNADARTAALRSIAGDDAKRQFFTDLRKNVASPLYESAKQQFVPVDDTLKSLMQRPSMNEALGYAEKIAAEEGTPISQKMKAEILADDGNGEISGEALHWLKIGLDAMRSDPKNAMGGVQQGALKNTIKQFEGWREANLPEYATAQKVYRKLTRPLNQMDIGDALLEKVNPALTDYGPLTNERAATFANALRNGDVTAKTATGFKGATMEGTMTKRQMQTLNKVAEDLSRKASADTSGRGIGSNTFQNIAMQDLAEEAGWPGKMLGRGVSRIPIVGEVISDLAKGGVANQEREIKEKLADVLLDPKKTAALLRGKPKPVERIIRDQFYRAIPAAGGTSISERFTGE